MQQSQSCLGVKMSKDVGFSFLKTHLMKCWLIFVRINLKWYPEDKRYHMIGLSIFYVKRL